MKILKIDKDGKTHYELGGKKITDQVILDYIRKLVIPPKYKDVVIFYEPEGEAKILYQGYDSKQRLQRIYSSLWNNKTAYSKFCELLNYYTHIIPLRGEKKYQHFLEFKVFKEPFLEKEFNTNDLLDYFFTFIILRKILT